MLSNHAVPERIPVRYVPRGGIATSVIRLMVAVGLVSFIAMLWMDPVLAWKSYVVNWNYFASVALGGVIVSAVTSIVKARWNWPLRRIHHSFAAYLPIALVLFLPMLLNLREDYFPWMEMMADDVIVQKKAAYLNIPFLVSRNLVGVAALFLMACFFVYLAVRPDLGHSGDRDEPRRGAARGRAWWREQLTRGWAGQAEEEARSYRRMTRMAPLLVLVFVVVMTMFAFDWIMSLEPHWFSTLFGGWFFMGAFWSGFAATAVAAIHLKGKDPVLDGYIGKAALWDVGKLTFAFTVFWTYLFWSQYIVIWYGKLEWEQAWINTRAGAPWGGLSALVLVLCFVVPFAGLLGAAPKKSPLLLRGFSVVVLSGLWLWHYMLIFPSLHHEGDPVFSVATPLIGLFFMGLFLGSVRWFLDSFPAVQLWQPPVDPEPLEAES